MKKKLVAFGTIIMLLVIILTPCINAISIENDTKEDDPILFGMVHGMVTNTGFPPLLHISGAKLELKGGLIKRITFSGILGMYSFLFVPFGPHSLTVSHPNYKTETVSFNLIPTEPCKVISFSLYEKENSKTKSLDTTVFRNIWGNTGTSSDTWGFSPVGLVKVEAGEKSTTSSPIMGFFKIKNLPLGTCKITGTKKGHDTFTETVKPTEKHPDKQVFIHIEPNDENVNRVKTKIVKNNDITNEQTCFGTIVGKTGTYMWSGWCPIYNVKITIGFRTKYSKPHFFFTGLPLDQTYTVTASKPGWKTETREVTLTKNNPIENIWFEMDDNGDKNAKTDEQNKKASTEVLI